MWAFTRPTNPFKKLKEVFDGIWFLPPYTPQFAPVELFFNILKEKLKKNIFNSVEAKSKSKVLAKIIKEAKTISNSSVIWCFSTALKGMKKAIT